MSFSYQKSEIKDNKIVKTSVTETEVLSLYLRQARGTAILTHVGGYKRLRFILDGKSYSSESGNKIAISDDETDAILLDNISFDKDIEEHWKNFNASHKRFWMPTEG